MRRKHNMGEVMDMPDFSDVESGVETTATQTPSLVRSFIDKFNAAVADLDNAVLALTGNQVKLAALESQASLDPNDYAAWQSEMDKVNAAAITIQTARDAVAQVSQWWNAIKTQYANLVQAAGLGGLIFIPWSVVAAITAAAVGIWAIVRSSADLEYQLSYKQWVANGSVGPAPTPPAGGSILPGISDAAKILAIGFAAYLILPALFKRGK